MIVLPGASTENTLALESRVRGDAFMLMEIVRFETHLSEESLQQMLDEKRDTYRHTRGLVQQVFLRRAGSSEYAGVYLWEGGETNRATRTREPEVALAADHRIVGDPSLERFEVMSIL
jgi:hypothetical protein